ncbi:MAG: hypothetical protein Q7S05_00495 [bacterium]|nr:hypothetical protein [bacterium]
MPDLEHEEWLRDRQAQKDAAAERLKRIAKAASNPPKKDDGPQKKKVGVSPDEEEDDDDDDAVEADDVDEDVDF